MDRRTFLLASAATLVAPVLRAQEADDEAVNVKDSLPLPDTSGMAPVILSGEPLARLHQVHEHLLRVRRVVGYGNFNLLDFDTMRTVGRRYPQAGVFDQMETDFIEELFYADANRYGFHGRKVLGRLTDTIPERALLKVPHTGHYLYRGRAEAVYERIKADLGAENIVLTSGVRGTVKQLQLFLAKALATGGNLSLASRSLAPPGYSFHGVGDFDVGKIGFGYLNFTEAFATTPEYARLTQLGYISIRYPEGNPDGVRFEPWHIKVV